MTSSFRSVFEDITAHSNLPDAEENVSLQMWHLLGNSPRNSPAHSGRTPLPEKYLVHRDLRPGNGARLGSENVFLEPSPMPNRPSTSNKQLCCSCMADATFQLMDEVPLFSLSEGFCTPDNIQDSLAHLDQELCLLGYSSIYHKSRSKSSGRAFDLVQLVNVTNDLIAGHHKHLNKQRELEDQNHKFSSEIRHLENTQQHLKDQITSSKQDEAMHQERQRQLQAELVSQEKKMKRLQDDVRKLKSVLQSRDTQFRHDLRKKERELAKVKDRLHALAEKKKERRQGIEILNVIPRGDGHRKMWKTSKEEKKCQEEMHRSIVANYEQREKELRTENQELRETLTFLQQEVSTVFSAVSRQEREHHPMSPDSLDDEVGDGHLQMPYEAVQNIVEGKLKDQLSSMLHLIGIQTSQGIKERNCASDEAKLNDLNAGQSATKAGSEVHSRSSNGEEEEESDDDSCATPSDEVDAKLEAYKTLIMKQEELIQQTFAAAECQQDTQVAELVKDSLFIEERMTLERERKEMEAEKATFAEERKRFTDAAIRLGKDRQKFEEERTNFLKYQYLNMTPPQAASYSHAVSMATASGSMMSSPSHPMTSSHPMTPSHAVTSSVLVTSSHPMTSSHTVTSGLDKSAVSSPFQTKAASRVQVPVTSTSTLAVSSVPAGRLSVSPGTAEFYRVLDQFPSPTRGNVNTKVNNCSTTTPAKGATAQSVPPTPSTGDLYRVLDQLPSPLHNRLSLEQQPGGPSWLYKNQTTPTRGRHSMLCKVQTPQPVALRGTLFDPRRRRTWASPQCFRGVQASLFQ
ncbi:afadin- and alpha-actinin-binding protein-like isoform X1 [Branchiostoma floridae]|uniref:Afadin- and alpha-actinin-binding protein-like isoform X1 n=1 Tax=Branchiostoma floridae TaxID=7739 RepID=A0A9J7MGL5_BRAFL|nr:afadin- and alpha-actinin-binding protein-like isoform X1 [Branchiostoma floridae]